jgi:hypothetical protein
MATGPNRKVSGCQEFREELEVLPLENTEIELRTLLGALSPASREHASQCLECREAAEDLAMTRAALQPLAELSAKPGPWFALRVMAAIAGQESEIDLRDAVWVSIRKFAPRLVAVCALLLLLASTWTYQLRHVELAGPPQVATNETVLEPSQPAPLNDDVLINSSEGHR